VTEEVPALTTAELARRAGTTPGPIERLVGLGILVPAEGDAPWRDSDVSLVRLASACERAGLPLELIGAAVRDGRLSFAQLGALPWSSAELAGATYAELGERHGLEPELVGRAWEAYGFGRPDLDEPVRALDADILAAMGVGPILGVDPAASLRSARVYGENLRRIASAEAQFYHDHVEGPLLASGMGEQAMRAAATEMSAAFIPVIERMLMAIYYRHREHYMIADLVEHIEAVLEEVGYQRPPAHPPAMCFVDLVGYTRLTEEHGDAVAARLAADLAGVTTEVAGRHGGQPVKWLGDGVMLHFPDPVPGVRAALELAARTPAIGLPPAHVGLHSGPVVLQDGDYYGRTVNLAARVAGQAGPGQVLVTEQVVAAGGDGLRFRTLGPATLKGVGAPVVLHEALPPG
jgi:adenylate cyclase